VRVTVGVEAHTHEFIATAHEDQKFGFSLSSGAAFDAAARIVRESASDPELIGTVAHHFLQWLGVLIGGWQWVQYATTALAGKHDADAEATLTTAAFYAAHILPRMRMHAAIVAAGSGALTTASPSSI